MIVEVLAVLLYSMNSDVIWIWTFISTFVCLGEDRLYILKINQQSNIFASWIQWAMQIMIADYTKHSLRISFIVL